MNDSLAWSGNDVNKKISLAIFLAILILAFTGCSEEERSPSGDGTQGDDESRSTEVSDSEEFAVSGELITALSTNSKLEVARALDGRFVVIWKSTNGDDIYIRLFDSDATPLGASFALGAGDKAVDPMVAMDATGNFTVAWRTLTDNGNGDDVLFQRFDSTGVPKAAPQSALLYTGLLDVSIPQQGSIQGLSIQEGPQQIALGMGPDGGFIIGWVRHGWGRLCCIPDLALEGVPLQAKLYTIFYARAFNAAGQPEAEPILISSQSADWPPAVAMDSDGGFVAAWRAGGLLAGDELLLRRYDQDGTPMADGVGVPDTSGSIPTLGIDASNSAVLMWSRGTGPDYEIKVQRFGAEGSPVGSALVVAGDDQSDPPFVEPARLAVSPSGSFAVVWAQRGPLDADDPQYDVYMRCYTSEGTPKDDPVVVNDSPLADSFAQPAVVTARPAVASDGYGDFVVVWQRSLEGINEIRGRRIKGC